MWQYTYDMKYPLSLKAKFWTYPNEKQHKACFLSLLYYTLHIHCENIIKVEKKVPKILFSSLHMWIFKR